jgi:hypothetical protein
MNITREDILAYDLCFPARVWLKANPDLSMPELWHACPDGLWLMWFLEEFDLLTRHQSVQLAVAFVRETPLGDGRFVYDLLTDPRSTAAIEAAEAWLRGEIDDEKLLIAADAPADAAAAAAAAADAVEDVVRATYLPAADKFAAASADAAADAANRVINPDFNSDTDTIDAGVLAAQAGIVRKYVNPFEGDKS